jgi:hypothetical protein
MSDFNYIEYLKNNPLKETKTQSIKLITEAQEAPKAKRMTKSELKEKIREEILSALNEEEVEDMPIDEAKKDEEVDAEVDVAVEEPAMDAAPDQSQGLTAEEQEIQNSLKIAYDNAASIGDQKLADQIGNSITFFTRTHVVER